MESPVKGVTVPLTQRKQEAELTSYSMDMTSPSPPEHEGCDRPVSSSELQAETTKAPKSVRCSEKEATPDNKITMLAVALALLDKAASACGTLSFIWVTMVILGAFAQYLKNKDFWFVTIILVLEGALIWGRRGEVAAEAASYFHFNIFFKLLIIVSSHTIQGCSALACFILSNIRLARLFYGDSDSGHRNPALCIFYSLSLVETSLILLGFWPKLALLMSLLSDLDVSEVDNGSVIYWLVLAAKKLGMFFGKLYGILPWGLNAEEVVTEVNKRYGFDNSERRTVRSFFYHTYSRCINGSVFDGLKMEFVTYSVELLLSSAVEEQLTATRVLSALVKSDQYKLRTMRTIETTQDVLKRLIEMLNCENHYKPEIRNAAANIIFRLMEEKKQNRIRVTAIAGSMESIASLVNDSNQNERDSRQYGIQSPHGYDCQDLSLLGVRILKSLASDHHSRDKMISNIELFPKIIGLVKSSPNASESQILAIDTLTSLALEQEGRESIGGTGNVLRDLFSIFFTERMNDNTTKLLTKAGEALALLSLDNKQNCQIMMNIKAKPPQGRVHPNLISSLISVVNDPVQGIHVARILRNLCAYAEVGYDELKEITATKAQVEECIRFTPHVVVIVKEKRGADQEAAIGLAAQLFKLMKIWGFDHVFKELGGETKRSLISEVVKVLQRHRHPSKEFPSIRRFSIELLIAVMEMERGAIEMRSEVEEALEGVMETMAEVESYIAISGKGSVRLRHGIAIPCLVQSAMLLLRN